MISVMPFKESKRRPLFRNRSKISIGIVGCGTIGSELAYWIQGELKNRTELVALYDLNPSKVSQLNRLLPNDISTSSLQELVKKSDLVIESASIDAVSEVAKCVFQEGRDLLVMSAGGLLRQPELMVLAKEHGSKIYLPSGAIGGLDAVKAASLAGIQRIILTTRKSPEALSDAPYWMERQKDWRAIQEETVLFEGEVLDAIRLFPKNVNVAATLQLVAHGAPCQIRVIVVPGLKENIHEIQAEGTSGKMTFRVENVPAPDNPSTSYLAILSAKALLRQIVSVVQIGT